jgi:uncharacterized Fe-S radical SAM superfamily protein PflX
MLEDCHIRPRDCDVNRLAADARGIYKIPAISSTPYELSQLSPDTLH